MSEQRATYDAVKQPSHYIRNGLECIDAIKAAVEGLDGFEGYCIGNVIKYSWRWKQKDGIQDLRKAQEYLHILTTALEGDRDAQHIKGIKS